MGQPFLFTWEPPLLRRRVHSKFVFEAKKQFKNEDYSIVEVHGWPWRSQQPKWKDPGYGFEKYETSHRSDSFVCNHGFGYDLGDLLLLPFGLINYRCQLVEEARTPNTTGTGSSNSSTPLALILQRTDAKHPSTG